MKPLWIIGSGGHASEVIENARSGTAWEPVALLDDESRKRDTTFYDVPVTGPVSPERLSELNASHAVIAIGSNRVRALFAERLDQAVKWATMIHPTAYVAHGSTIAPGVMIGVFAVVQPGSHLDMHVIVNTNAVVGHDVIVGAYAHVGPGVILAGGVEVGEGAFLGTGANVIPGIRVGKWSTVGAGAVVIRDVPDGATVVGVPARVVQP